MVCLAFKIAPPKQLNLKKKKKKNELKKKIIIKKKKKNASGPKMTSGRSRTTKWFFFLGLRRNTHTNKCTLSISQLSTIGEFAYTQVNKLHNLWFFSTVPAVTDKFNLCWLHSPPTHKEVSDWCDQSHTHKYCTHTLSQSSVHCMNLPIHRSTNSHAHTNFSKRTLASYYTGTALWCWLAIMWTTNFTKCVFPLFTRQIKCHFNKHLEEKKIFPDFPEEMDEFPDFPWLFASGKNIFKFPDFPEIPWPVRTLYKI